MFHPLFSFRNSLPSIHKKVCQCLAMFIKWADEILLYGDKGLNKAAAHDVITALSEGVEVISYIELNNLLQTNEKFRLRCLQQQKFDLCNFKF